MAKTECVVCEAKLRYHHSTTTLIYYLERSALLPLLIPKSIIINNNYYYYYIIIRQVCWEPMKAVWRFVENFVLVWTSLHFTCSDFSRFSIGYKSIWTGIRWSNCHDMVAVYGTLHSCECKPINNYYTKEINHHDIKQSIFQMCFTTVGINFIYYCINYILFIPILHCAEICYKSHYIELFISFPTYS